MKLAVVLAFLSTWALAGPVSYYGMLKTCKINDKGALCGSKNGFETKSLQVKGPSLFWSVGEGAGFYNQETVDWFVENMNISVIRAAMAIRFYSNNTSPITGGYYESPSSQKTMIKRVVDAAIFNDIYVIVDWHSHNANSTEEIAKAKVFFKEMATEYKNTPNIIWEVYNEPVTASLGQISDYAQAIIKEIRDAGSQNLVLIGSPQYAKQPKEQAQNWFGTSGRDNNVAFTFHFYAATHPISGEIGTSAKGAIDAGYTVFGSEWGSVSANGGGSVDAVKTKEWTDWMDANAISNCNWNISNKAEASTMFKPETQSGTLSVANLSVSGTNFLNYMGNNKWIDKVSSDQPQGKGFKATVKYGNSITITATQLGLNTGTTISEVGQPEFGSASFTSNSITYTTSQNSLAKTQFIYKITKGSVVVQNKITIIITERPPILPEKNPVNVSRRAPYRLRLLNDLSASDPSGLKISLKAASLQDPSKGEVSIAGTDKDTLVFTPSAAMHNIDDVVETTLNYTVENTEGTSSSQNIVLRIRNNMPNISNNAICCLSSKPNTSPIGIGIKQVSGTDIDKDSLWFAALYLAPQYPGRIEKVKADSFVYYPEDNKTGKVVFLAVVTDGSLDSPIGRTNLTLTGNGSDIGTITPPTEIPGYAAPIISQPRNALGFGIKAFGSSVVEVYFAKSGFAKLDIYSLSGKNMGTLLNGYQNSGSSEVSLKTLNLKKGFYILRLKHGQQFKIMRIAI